MKLSPWPAANCPAKAANATRRRGAPEGAPVQRTNQQLMRRRLIRRGNERQTMETVRRIAMTSRKGRRSILWLALLTVLAIPAAAKERVVLQKNGANQARARDAFLDQGSPATNHGADTTLRVQSFNNGTSQNQRAVVMFDLSPIPRSGIKLATLDLFMSTAPSSSRAYIAERMLSLWTESDVTWNNRLPGTPWVTVGGGGDFGSSGSSTIATGTISGVHLIFDTTQILQRKFNRNPPEANFGFLIRDSTEDSLVQFTGILSSKEDATLANRPQLTVEFIQQVTGLTAVAGNDRNTLTWSYPTDVAGGTVLSPRNGVLILRQEGSPIGQTAVPTDGVVPAPCSLIGGALVVFVDNTLATSFIDDITDPCGDPLNGITYYYQVFTRDAADNWSAGGTLGGANENVPEITATPGATASTQQAAAWMAPTGATTLAAPGIDPSNVVVIGSDSNLLQGVNPSNGVDVYAPASTGGVISGRPPALEAVDDSLSRPATYVANQDNFVYAIDASTGEIVWLSNPTGLTTNTFVGGAAVLLKSVTDVGYTLAQDLVVVGMHDTGTTTANEIAGINANTGATVWTVVGGTSSAASCGGVCNLDIVSSTPAVDYVNNAIWVTSRNANSVAATVNRPDLWKIDPSTGSILSTVNLGGDIDSAPSLPLLSDFVFVGANGGTLYAINPATLATVASFTPAPANGAIKGFPVVLGVALPYTIIFSTNGNVNAVSFDGVAFTFLWKTPITAPSTPISAPGLTTVYVGSSDGKIHELDLTTGADNKQRIVDTGATVGDPSLDVVLNRIIVGSTDGRVYAFTFPF
jgi:outer membrane protein assembly factor BamB